MRAHVVLTCAHSLAGSYGWPKIISDLLPYGRVRGSPEQEQYCKFSTGVISFPVSIAPLKEIAHRLCPLFLELFARMSGNCSLACQEIFRSHARKVFARMPRNCSRACQGLIVPPISGNYRDNVRNMLLRL